MKKYKGSVFWVMGILIITAFMVLFLHKDKALNEKEVSTPSFLREVRLGSYAEILKLSLINKRSGRRVLLIDGIKIKSEVTPGGYIVERKGEKCYWRVAVRFVEIEFSNKLGPTVYGISFPTAENNPPDLFQGSPQRRYECERVIISVNREYLYTFLAASHFQSFFSDKEINRETEYGDEGCRG